MLIRQEEEKDFQKIHDFVRIAFETAPVSDGDEQEYVLKYRVEGNYIPELALVMEEDNEIIGHIMLTKLPIGDFTGLLLSPVAIKEDYRSCGMGSKLIRYSLEKAAKMGFTAVFLVGNPDYYKRFGFRLISNFKVVHECEEHAPFVQALELVPGALDNVEGMISIC